MKWRLTTPWKSLYRTSMVLALYYMKSPFKTKIVISVNEAAIQQFEQTKTVYWYIYAVKNNLHKNMQDVIISVSVLNFSPFLANVVLYHTINIVNIASLIVIYYMCNHPSVCEVNLIFSVLKFIHYPLYLVCKHCWNAFQNCYEMYI